MLENSSRNYCGSHLSTGSTRSWLFKNKDHGSQDEHIRSPLTAILADATPLDVIAFAAISLGLIYVGSYNKEVAQAIIFSLMDQSESGLVKPLTRLLPLGLGLLYLGIAIVSMAAIISLGFIGARTNNALSQLHIALLKGIPPVNKNLSGPDAWMAILLKKLAPWWPWVAEGEIPLGAGQGEEVSSILMEYGKNLWNKVLLDHITGRHMIVLMKKLRPQKSWLISGDQERLQQHL